MPFCGNSATALLPRWDRGRSPPERIPHERGLSDDSRHNETQGDSTKYDKKRETKLEDKGTEAAEPKRTRPEEEVLLPRKSASRKRIEERQRRPSRARPWRCRRFGALHLFPVVSLARLADELVTGGFLGHMDRGLFGLGRVCGGSRNVSVDPTGRRVFQPAASVVVLNDGAVDLWLSFPSGAMCTCAVRTVSFWPFASTSR